MPAMTTWEAWGFSPILPLVTGIFIGALAATLLPRGLKCIERRLDRRRKHLLRSDRRLEPGPVHRALCRHLHGTAKGPFEGLSHRFCTDDTYPYTNLPSDFLSALFERLCPGFLVEVGSFKGGSARRVAEAVVATAPRGKPTPCLLCIDTFLGDAGMWLDRNPGWRVGLQLEHGCPQFYWQFMVNLDAFRDVVLPLPMGSMSALRAVQHLVLRGDVPAPEFIYLDSAHEKGETHLEIMQAFQLLGVGGVLVGDDLDWPAVEEDLRGFLASGPAVAGMDDALLSALPKLHYKAEEGYWVLDSSPQQWVLRKTAGSVAELRKHVDQEECGVAPAAFGPLTDADHAALALYEEAVALSEAGHIQQAMPLYKKAAGMSASLAFHFKL